MSMGRSVNATLELSLSKLTDGVTKAAAIGQAEPAPPARPAAPAARREKPEKSDKPDKPDKPGGGGGEVVRLDRFRKK